MMYRDWREIAKVALVAGRGREASEEPDKVA
jgi:hypothetical protein